MIHFSSPRMSDRLPELQRQRALIQGHLAWLDQEIASATGKPATPLITPLPVAKPAITATARPPASAVEEPLTDDLIAKFGTETQNSTESVRRGCYIFFAVALVILLVGVYGLYRYSKNLHAHDAPPKAKSVQDSPESR
jgi:hypothetical protein